MPPSKEVPAPSIRPIYWLPCPFLRAISSPLTLAEAKSSETSTLIGDMVATMRHFRLYGIGAPMIGVNQRVIVALADPAEKDGKLLTLINPRVIAAEGGCETSETTPCLSGVMAHNERAAKIKVRALQTNGQPYTVRADDTLSVVLQHQIDLLDGIVCFDSAIRITVLAKPPEIPTTA